ncbi:hypothetical protein [Roseiconus lacunae]|uniref:hypothetical protein n=1 Tax=Roseiconus lacunae TaxID=2605694 RepID=UPI001E537511|nr:hypothetical protein [Roseiconus lacunae]
MDDFAAITCYFNPCGYRNRERAYERFAAEMDRQGVQLWTIEAVLPDEKPFIESGPRVVHVTLPRNEWIWQKERLLNLLMKRIPASVTKIGWVDCDLLFENDQWPQLAIEALNTWPIIQLFDWVYWLGPDDEVIPMASGANRWACLASIAMYYPSRARDFRIGTPGFAWAARRSLLQRHGLYEYDISGGNDTLVAAASYGWADHPFVSNGTKAMEHDARNYIRKFFADVRGYVGYIPCPIRHLWHGSLKNRSYVGRRQTLGQYGFDPFRDVTDDTETGLLRWTQFANPELKKQLKNYFFSRREDDRETN